MLSTALPSNLFSCYAACHVHSLVHQCPNPYPRISNVSHVSKWTLDRAASNVQNVQILYFAQQTLLHVLAIDIVCYHCAGQEREQVQARTSEVVDTKERIVEVTPADPCGGVPTAEFNTSSHGVTSGSGTGVGSGITGSRTGTTGAGYGSSSGTGTGTGTGYGSSSGTGTGTGTGTGGRTIA